MNNEAVCRTAPGTPGLLKIINQLCRKKHAENIKPLVFTVFSPLAAAELPNTIGSPSLRAGTAASFLAGSHHTRISYLYWG